MTFESVFFSPANFLLFFFVFAQVSSKKTDTREKKHTTTHRKTLFLSLRNNINTLRTKTHRREKAGNNNLRFLFLFSLVVSEGVFYIHTSLRLKRRERSSLKIHLSEKREFEILNIRLFARERELLLSYHRHKKEANKCRTRKKRPRRKR